MEKEIDMDLNLSRKLWQDDLKMFDNYFFKTFFYSLEQKKEEEKHVLQSENTKLIYNLKNKK